PDRGLDHRPGQAPVAAGGRRGGRDPRAGHLPQARRLRHRPGLSLQPPAAGWTGGGIPSILQRRAHALRPGSGATSGRSGAGNPVHSGPASFRAGAGGVPRAVGTPPRPTRRVVSFMCSDHSPLTHRIGIVAGGARGLELATRLGRSLGKRGKARITLVDCNLTHLWKPLLHEVAAGSLNTAENELNYVAQAKWNHFEFQIGRFERLDRANKRIGLAATLDDNGQELVPARSLAYDTLVIAVGSRTNDFGTPGVAEHCIMLDTTRQARRFHRKLLSHYLPAHASGEDTGRVSVAIVGAGATGVELAAELHNAALGLSAYGLKGIQPHNMKITLIEAGPRVLPALDRKSTRLNSSHVKISYAVFCLK